MKFVNLKSAHLRCSICSRKYTSDLESTDQEIRFRLPVISESTQWCGHYFCYECILNQQAKELEKNNYKKTWISCLTCRAEKAFNCPKPKFHRMLIDLLDRAQDIRSIHQQLINDPESLLKDDEDDEASMLYHNLPFVTRMKEDSSTSNGIRESSSSTSTTTNHQERRVNSVSKGEEDTSSTPGSRLPISNKNHAKKRQNASVGKAEDRNISSDGQSSSNTLHGDKRATNGFRGSSISTSTTGNEEKRFNRASNLPEVLRKEEEDTRTSRVSCQPVSNGNAKTRQNVSVEKSENPIEILDSDEDEELDGEGAEASTAERRRHWGPSKTRTVYSPKKEDSAHTSLESRLSISNGNAKRQCATAGKVQDQGISAQERISEEHKDCQQTRESEHPRRTTMTATVTATTKLAVIMDFPIGTKLEKKSRHFCGKVIATPVPSAPGADYYKVLYSDGKMEEYDLNELLEILIGCQEARNHMGIVPIGTEVEKEFKMPFGATVVGTPKYGSSVYRIKYGHDNQEEDIEAKDLATLIKAYDEKMDRSNRGRDGKIQGFAAVGNKPSLNSSRECSSESDGGGTLNRYLLSDDEEEELFGEGAEKSSITEKRNEGQKSPSGTSDSLVITIFDSDDEDDKAEEMSTTVEQRRQNTSPSKTPSAALLSKREDDTQSATAEAMQDQDIGRQKTRTTLHGREGINSTEKNSLESDDDNVSNQQDFPRQSQQKHRRLRLRISESDNEESVVDERVEAFSGQRSCNSASIPPEVSTIRENDTCTRRTIRSCLDPGGIVPSGSRLFVAHRGNAKTYGAAAQRVEKESNVNRRQKRKRWEGRQEFSREAKRSRMITTDGGNVRLSSAADDTVMESPSSNPGQQTVEDRGKEVDIVNIKREHDGINVQRQRKAHIHRKYGDRVLLGRQAKNGMMKLGGGNCTMEMWPSDKTKDKAKVRARQVRYNAIGNRKAMAYGTLWQRDALSYAGIPSGDVSCVPNDLAPNEAFSIFMKRESRRNETLGWEYIGDYRLSDPDNELEHWGDANAISDADKRDIAKGMPRSKTWGRRNLDYFRTKLTLEHDESPALSDKRASLSARARHLGFHAGITDKELARVIVNLDEYYTQIGVTFVCYNEEVYNFVKAGETTKNANGQTRKAGEPCAKASDWYTIHDANMKKK